MLKKTITYIDFEDRERTEDFYFHMSKAELIELEVSAKEGFTKKIERLQKSQDGGEIIAIFKEILLMSVGKKSEDGKRFIKNQEIRDDLMFSPAYSELFMELSTDTDQAISFVNGLVTASMLDEARKAAAAEGKSLEDWQRSAVESASDDSITTTPQPIEEVAADPIPEPTAQTEHPLVEKDPKDMTREELIEAMRIKSQG